MTTSFFGKGLHIFPLEIIRYAHEKSSSPRQSGARNDTIHFLGGGSQARAAPAPDSINQYSLSFRAEILSEAKGWARNYSHERSE